MSDNSKQADIGALQAPALSASRMSPVRRATLVIAASYIVVACFLFLPLLSSSGLVMTEGHRAIPGWTMLDPDVGLGEIRLYEASYARKPPGAPWFFAVSAAVLGPTPFSARLVSVFAIIVSGIAAWWFCAGWFRVDRDSIRPGVDARWMIAGIPAFGAFAAIFTPMLWPIARSAEIEGLLVMGAALASFGVLDAGLAAANRDGSAGENVRHRGRAITAAISTAVGVCVVIVTKGPAGVPVIAAAFVAPAIVTRSFRPLGSPRVWGPALLGAAVAGWSLRDYVFQLGMPNTITEDVSGFLFKADRLHWVLLLPAAAFVAALPASLGLLFSWGKDARAEAERSVDAARARTAAHACAVAWVLAACVYAASGLSNPRYVMPAVVLVWPLWSYVARGVLVPGAFTEKRGKIARVFVLGRPSHIAASLAIAGVVFAVVYEQRRQRISGRDAGDALLEALIADNAAGANVPIGRIAVLADGVVEARPEILLPISQAGARVVWHKPTLRTYGAGLPQQIIYLALRQDDGSDELTDFDPGAWLPESVRSYHYRMERIAEHRTHKFNTVLVRLHRGERRR